MIKQYYNINNLLVKILIINSHSINFIAVFVLC